MLDTKGADLIRYKGVISCAGMSKKFVFQGVNMLFNGNFTTEWAKDETRSSRFVFIGRNLNPVEIREAFTSCTASQLRFSIGSAVMAKREKSYERGTVIGQWDEGNPYRIRLDSGIEVWAPGIF
jgi:Cobalamin synthesis protein cobW C-terminal domain